MKKAGLRTEFLKLRSELTREERELRQDHIAGLFFSEIPLGRMQTIHAYIPMLDRAELDPAEVIVGLQRRFAGIRILAPRINSKEIESIEIVESTEFAVNRFGVTEARDGEIVEAEEIDLVLVPLLAFDLNAHRVGYGGGFYDRFLVNCRSDCLKVGLSFFSPVDEIDDVHDQDVPLNFCITPEKVFSF